MQRDPPEFAEELGPGCNRMPGGGRQPSAIADETLFADPEVLLEVTARGDPMSLLSWTCEGARKLAAERKRAGYAISHMTVDRLPT
jgi:hypothetical protein